MVGDLAVYRLAGPLPLATAVQMVTSAISLARAEDVRRLMVVLLDLTGFEPPDVVTRYAYVEEWAQASSGVVRVAFVVRPERIEPQGFDVTVARNRGFRAEVFATEAEALAWLRGMASPAERGAAARGPGRTR